MICRSSRSITVADGYELLEFVLQVSTSSSSETTSAIAAAHAAVAGLDVAAADAIHNCFSVMTSHIQRLERDRTSLAQALRASQVPILSPTLHDRGFAPSISGTSRSIGYRQRILPLARYDDDTYKA